MGQSCATKVKPCSCEHEFQDATYGKGMRVHNVKPATQKTPEVESCTVCGKGARAPSPSKQHMRSPRMGKIITGYPVK